MYSAAAVSPRIAAIVKEFNQFQQHQTQIDAQLGTMTGKPFAPA